MEQEWEIGKIFKYNGEWYQCVVAIDGCRECSFRTHDYCTHHLECLSDTRSDKTSVIFKKLEKVGEPITERDRTFQCLKALKTECVGCVFLDSKKSCNKVHYIDGLCSDDEIWVEIKQNKENMEEYKIYDAKEDIPEFDKVVDECLFGEDKLKLKPFNLQKAREGKPVYTRNGHKARIVCFDRINARPILALVRSTDGKGEDVFDYFVSGKRLANALESDLDLMMLPEKKEGWVNVYYDNDASSHRGCRFIYDTKEQAIKEAGSAYITTVKINWEE